MMDRQPTGHAHINERPQSPRQDEIEAIIAKAMAPQPMATARLVELRRAIATVEAAEEEAGPGEARTDATQDRIDRLYAPFDAMTQTVWDTPPTTPVDLHERAIIARHWFNVGRADWENPCDLDDWGDQAIAQLIHGVLQLAGSDIDKAMAPAEAPALHVSELGRKLRADLARFDAWSGKDVSDADWDDVFASDWDEIYRLEAQIPNPPRSFADVVARAELAYFGADKGPDNRTMDLDEGDCWEGPVARLIEAVLQFAGSDIAAEGRRHG